jgi:hypothetical protein
MARGGKRAGAGRKAKWGTDTETMRIPKVLRAEVLAFIKERMEQLHPVTETKRGPAAINSNGDALRQQPAPLPASHKPAEPLDLRDDSRQCQCGTANGQRCSIKTNLLVETVPHNGRMVTFWACPIHADRGKPHDSFVVAEG